MADMNGDTSQVLVPARLFIMRSRDAKYPQNVLSLVSTKLAYAAEARTISLPVVRSSTWQEHSHRCVMLALSNSSSVQV